MIPHPDDPKNLFRGSAPGDYSRLVAEAGPCRLGGIHTTPARNGMVYCEHRVSVFACHDGCTALPPLDPDCDQCGRPKADHTEAEAAYCVGRGLASITDRNVYVTG